MKVKAQRLCSKCTCYAEVVNAIKGWGCIALKPALAIVICTVVLLLIEIDTVCSSSYCSLF